VKYRVSVKGSRSGRSGGQSPAATADDVGRRTHGVLPPSARRAFARAGRWYHRGVSSVLRSKPLAARAALFLGVAGIAACGPSFQALYESNARFEHCYALEESPQVPMADKAACWREWSERYTYGQTRDRIYYATARYVALSEAARNIPTDEALMMAAPGETPRRSNITAPTPTNAFAPPPKVLDPNEQPSAATAMVEVANIPVMDVDAGLVASSAAPPPAPLPGTSCADKCAGDYHACSGGCQEETGSSAKAKECAACSKKYRACMRACFK